MIITKDIYLPLDSEGPFEHIKTQQCSSDSLQVRVTLICNSQPIDLPEGIVPQVLYEKPDGHKVVNDCEMDGQYILVNYTKQMLIAAGTAKAQIYYQDESGEKLSSAFYTDIYPTVGGILEESTSEFNSLSSFVQSASGYASDASNSADIAEEYYKKTKNISESISGTLRPKGTVLFSNLPDLEDAEIGDMYNISEQFITTDKFREGVGHVIPSGSNVFKTVDGYWDVLSGSPVTGVKGSKEEEYRTGNVDITPENIGAVPDDGDIAENVITFENADSDTVDAWTNVDVITTGEKVGSLLAKISKMIKNVRYLFKLLGSEDISSIGGGTVTGGIKELNSNLTPISLGQYDGSAMGGKNGGIVIESKAGSFSQSTALAVELKHTPVNPYGVVVSQTTQASNSAHLVYANVTGKTLTINMSTVCGAVRFAIAYLTADDMTV